MNLLKWCFPTFYPLIVWWYRTFTLYWKVLTLTIAFFIPSLYFHTGDLADFCAAGLALLLATKIASLIFRPRLTCQMESVSALTCDESVMVDLSVTNRQWLPTYDARVTLEANPRWSVGREAHVLSLTTPQQVATVASRVRPLRRGVQPWPHVRLESSFPFNLIRQTTRLAPPGDVLVYPRRVGMNDPILQGILATLGAEQLAVPGRVGVDGEFLGNREYQPGMRVRRFDHRRWARLGKPIVREYDTPQHLGLVLVVDNQTDEQASLERPAPQLEAAITLAAAVVDGCKQYEIPITQLWLAGQLPLVTTQESLTETALFESLARAAPVAELPFNGWVEDFSQTLFAENEQLLLVFRTWDAARRRFCEQLQELGIGWHGLALQDEGEREADVGSLPISFVSRNDYRPAEEDPS